MFRVQDRDIFISHKDINLNTLFGERTKQEVSLMAKNVTCYLLTAELGNLF